MKWLKTRYSLFMTTVYHGPMQQTEMYIWFWKSRWSNSDAQHFHSYWYWNFCCCCCRQQRLVCMCVRRLMKTEKENTQIHTNFFFLFESCENVRKIVARCFQLCVYNDKYHAYDNIWERVSFAFECDARFLAYIFRSLFRVRSLLLRIFTLFLVTRKIQWFSNCNQTSTAMKTKRYAFRCVTMR